jgi:hypothetical protein
MPQPLIFISHKHSDHSIATAIRSFINEQSRGTIRVFQSSDAAAVGPKVARELNQELQNALWEAKAVILVYTTEEKDWGYCMWECGVATTPGSPNTRVIVFQCSDHAPDVYSGRVRVDARTKAGLAPFVVQFMTDVDFLPDATEPITGYHQTAPEVAAATAKFHADLQAVLPVGEGSEWPAHPFLQMQLPASSVESLKKTAAEDRIGFGKAMLEKDALITGGDSVGKKLFGLADFASNLTFGELTAHWKSVCHTEQDGWVDALAEQVLKCAMWEFPTLRWAPMQGVTGGQPHAPVVTVVRRLPSGAIQLDIFFYPFTLLTATPVTARMVRRADMYCKILKPDAEKDLKILALLRELETSQFNRVPIFDEADRVLYLSHRSVMDQFITKRLTTGSVEGLGEVSLADMFAEQPSLKTILTKTFGFVPVTATLDQVRALMKKIPDCRDVFVTRTGMKDEPVEGWVTDVMIATGDSD